MIVQLSTTPIVPNTKAQCFDASVLNAISIRLLEKYKAICTFDPNVFFAKNHMDSPSGSEIWGMVKKTMPADYEIAFIFSLRMSRPKIEQAIKRATPIVVQISKWDQRDGLIVDGTRGGHFFVIYGYDDEKGYILQNPWGNTVILKKEMLNKVGSFLLVV